MKLLLGFKMVEAIRIFFLNCFYTFRPSTDVARSQLVRNHWGQTIQIQTLLPNK
jgi:hypothetical protein